MASNLLNSLKIYFPSILFVLLVGIDFFQGQWEFFNGKEEILFLIGLKAGVLFLLLIIALKVRKDLWIFLGILGICLAIGYGKNLIEPEFLRMLAKYLSPFIYFFGFKNLLDNPIKQELLKKVVSGIIYLGICSIIIGYLFEIQSFRTYYYRFGYKGFFKRSIDASYFIMFASIFIYAIRKELKRPWIPTVLLVIAAVLIGTKLPFLFLGAAAIILFFPYAYQSKKHFKIGVGILAAVILIGFLLMRKLLNGTYQLFHQIYLEKGIWSSLTSFRSDLLVDAYHFYQKEWGWYNYFFGGKSFRTPLVEMSLPDLLIFFGIIGMPVYLFFYLKTYFYPLALNFKKLFVVVLICSLLGGQFFFNPTVSLWFAVLIVLIQNSLISPEHPKTESLKK